MYQESKYQSGDLDVITPFYKEIECFLQKTYGRSFSLIDFGCGIRLNFERELLRSFPDCRVIGVDINNALDLPKGMIFYKADIQNNKQFGEKPYDIVYFSELIEHIDDGDSLLENCYSNCSEGGYLICTIPNLSSLFGRLELLFGMQPHILEASNRFPNAGMGLFGEKNNPEHVSIHHIRGFTYRAMVELISQHKFEIVFSKGTFRQKYLRPLSIIKPLAADILIIAKKRSNMS